jgi:hypothetical protein
MYYKLLFLTAIFFLQACATQNTAIAATDDDFTIHKIVIQMNTKNPEIQQEVLSNIVNTSKYFGIDNVQIELVAYGPGIYFLTKQSEFHKRIESLMLQDVIFSACADTINTIKRVKGIDLDMIDDVVLVKNGVPRIMLLQEQGYSYLSP